MGVCGCVIPNPNCHCHFTPVSDWQYNNSINHLVTMPKSVLDQIGEEHTKEIKRLRQQVAELVETSKATYSWISMWANHQGNCEGGTKCTCGKTAILFDVKDAIAKATGGE